MEKVALYKDIIQKELEYRQTIKIANGPELSRHLIIDKDRIEFILVDVGWFKKRYISEIVYHVEIKDGKVWIHCDNTDVGIADFFVSNGIPKSEIVLAFLPKYAQELSEFAVG